MPLQPKSIKKDDPVEIAPDIWWVGAFDTGLQCNAYLVKGATFHALIDSGSRPHFPAVLMKILKIGISPRDIGALIYQHTDPDLCGNVVDFVNLIDSENLKVISDIRNLELISHYGLQVDMMSTQSLNHAIVLDNYKKLQFYNTPHCHNAGSFISFEESTSTLFSSDILGGYGIPLERFLCPNLEPVSENTIDSNGSTAAEKSSDFPNILKFHQEHFPSTSALEFALSLIERLPFKRIAPQHGAILPNRASANLLINLIKNSGKIGMEYFLENLDNKQTHHGMRFP